MQALTLFALLGTVAIALSYSLPLETGRGLETSDDSWPQPAYELPIPKTLKLEKCNLEQSLAKDDGSAYDPMACDPTRFELFYERYAAHCSESVWYRSFKALPFEILNATWADSDGKETPCHFLTEAHFFLTRYIFAHEVVSVNKLHHCLDTYLTYAKGSDCVNELHERPNQEEKKQACLAKAPEWMIQSPKNFIACRNREIKKDCTIEASKYFCEVEFAGMKKCSNCRPLITDDHWEEFYQYCRQIDMDYQRSRRRLEISEC
ncbi:hypothetical protein L596_021757 [Steinernema carpocapsae]|uniref:ShKT domain-containing protein n=1 Tax=Steinernema carpocapsae TaxID=34508 RepID=A0A4U5MJQ9_STECR|nr:hypothetical protein L596_021757 [Steinernema carpocapsae]